jgi:signal transduction histidine kinase
MRCISSLLFVLMVHTVAAQQLPLDTYTPANGLVDTRITKMFQDSKGRIYFLTRQGFSIFDGRHFDNYANGNSKRTEIINGITEYSNGIVNLFSFDGTVYTVNNNTVITDTSNHSLLTETNSVYDIGPDDKLVVTNHYIIRQQNGKYIKLREPFKGQGYLNAVEMLFCKPFLIISHYIDERSNGIYLYNYETQQLTDSLPDHFFYESATDNNSRFFIRLNGWQQINNDELKKGKLRFTPSSITKYFPYSYKNSRMYFDMDNNIWLCNNDKGYCRISPSGEVNFLNSSRGILDAANYVFADREKNLWLASAANGVQKLQQSPLSRIEKTDGFNIGYTKSINTDENGSLFIHTISGLYYNNSKLSSKAEPLSFPAFYWQNQYWRFTDYKTLVGSGGTVFNIENYITGYKPVDFQQSFTCTDHEGRLVIAGSFIFTIDKNLQFHVYRPGYFCDNAVTDSSNNYWLFLRSSIVEKLTWVNGVLQRMQKDSFPDLNPRFTCMWNDSTFVVATRIDGIKIFTLRNNHPVITGTIDSRNGLSNNFVYTVLKKGHLLLVGTASGLDLVSFTNKDTIVENLSLRNNIFPSFVNAVAAKDSTIFCLTGDGQVYKLEKETGLSSSFIPKPFFRGIEVNGQPVNNGNSFAYNKNNFSFSVSAPSFLDNKNMKYSFVLAGKNQQWHQNNTSADFSINNLAPGSYHLTVTIMYPGKFYADQKLEYSFNVQKPFWLQWWFIILAIALLVSILFYAIQIYYRRKLEKQKILLEKELAIEQERTRMARELHDGLGSMLSGLKHSFTALQNQVLLDKPQEEKFNLNINRLNDSIKELRNIANSMYTDNSLKHGLENSLRDYCQFIGSSSGLQVSFNALEVSTVALSEEQSFHIFRIVQELLQNIIKHAAASSVIVQLSYNSGRMYVIVEDDGKGFDFATAKRNGGMGLRNIEARVKLLNGSVDYDTGGDKGTSVTIEVPCNISG